MRSSQFIRYPFSSSRLVTSLDWVRLIDGQHQRQTKTDLGGGVDHREDREEQPVHGPAGSGTAREPRG